MKSMILSMLTALALSDSVTNVIHENIPRLIENKRRLQINECSPEERASLGICKSIGFRYNPETDLMVEEYEMRYCHQDGSGEYTISANDKCNGEVISSSTQLNDPCCSQLPHTTTTPAATTTTTKFTTMPPEPTGYCSPEERASVGICKSIGFRYNGGTDLMVEEYEMRYCHEDGSGEYTISANDKCNGEVISSDIELNDPCCSQASHTTTTPAATTSTTEFIYTSTTGYCSPEERASVGICEPIGLEYNHETDSEVAAYRMRFCDYEDAYGSGGSTVYAYDDQCSDNNPTILRSYIESNDPCCLDSPIQRCERELDVCFYGNNGFSSTLSCDASGLKYTLWMGGDCSYDTQIASVHIADPLCCPQFSEHGEY